MTITDTPDISKSDAYKVGYSISMIEAIIEHLGTAAIQRAPSDDKIIADHIDAALAHAKAAHQALTTGDTNRPAGDHGKDGR